MDNLAPAISPPSGIGDSKPTNQAVLDWVQEVARLTEPENIFWCDGSDQENDYLLGEAQKQGVVLKLNEQKVPRSYLHRSNQNDVARVEQFTLICTPTKDEAGPTNNWSEPAETYTKLNGMLKGAMKGRTMFVIPYIMGPPESSLTKVGFEITDSIYVVLSMRIMTRMGDWPCSGGRANRMANGNRGTHSLLDVNPDRGSSAIFAGQRHHFGWLRYGGMFCSREMPRVRIVLYLARKQGWLADNPCSFSESNRGRKKTLRRRGLPERLCKTNFAMSFRRAFKGWKVTTIGDDIAWMSDRPGRPPLCGQPRERLRRVPGTSYKSNPNAMKSIEHDTLYTNVALTMTAMSGGKARMARLRATPSIGKATIGRPIQKRKRPTPIRVSPPRCATIPPSIPTWKKAAAFRSARSFSAGAAATRCRSFSRPAIGNTALTSARPWLLK